MPPAWSQDCAVQRQQKEIGVGGGGGTVTAYKNWIHQPLGYKNTPEVHNNGGGGGAASCSSKEGRNGGNLALPLKQCTVDRKLPWTDTV